MTEERAAKPASQTSFYPRERKVALADTTLPPPGTRRPYTDVALKLFDAVVARGALA